MDSDSAALKLFLLFFYDGTYLLSWRQLGHLNSRVRVMEYQERATGCPERSPKNNGGFLCRQPYLPRGVLEIQKASSAFLKIEEAVQSNDDYFTNVMMLVGRWACRQYRNAPQQYGISHTGCPQTTSISTFELDKAPRYKSSNDSCV
ncbi:hypothetical protein PsorP6_013719 [Peronosclerospora sorghi]|uniref:Uncharacterized protein n=1 Tax=Peronosclerospora sorghi TaxID=230839 RepID=A0ACC0VFK1_9STRA|nr:hypothetical protein PsorP6_013719 [Peronosclerospora sorghi]